MAQISIISR